MTFHTGVAGLQALRASWDAILGRKSQPRFFHEWSWYRAYLENLEPVPEEVCFGLLTNGNGPVAIVPLQSASQSYRGLTERFWRLPEHSHMSLADVICADDVSGEELVARLLAAMRARRMRWDCLQLSRFGDESGLSCTALTVGRGIYRDTPTTCDYLVCDRPWEALARGFSANFRSNLNKARHKIDRAGGAHYEFVNDPGRIHAVFAEHLQVEASGWKGAAGTRSAISLDPRLVGFYNSLIDDFAPAGRVFVNLMRFGERVIASQFCLCDADTIYVLKLGYDESFAHLGPGNSLLEQIVRWCSMSTRLRKINLVGSPPWFQDWKPEHSNLYRLRIFNRTALGQLHRIEWAARARLRPWVHAMRDSTVAHRLGYGHASNRAGTRRSA